MTLTHEDENWIDDRLEAPYRLSTAFSGVNLNQVREYIDVGEYGLALDGLAYVQLEYGKPVTAEIVRLFDALATKMEMRQGDEWRAVAEIRLMDVTAQPACS